MSAIDWDAVNQPVAASAVPYRIEINGTSTSTPSQAAPEAAPAPASQPAAAAPADTPQTSDASIDWNAVNSIAKATPIPDDVQRALDKKSMGLDATQGQNSLLAGIGNGMASGIRALGGGAALGALGLPATKEDADRLNVDLNNTTSGRIGTAIGVGALTAPAMLVPGANTYAGATYLGALTGGALTEGGIADRAIGAGTGALGGFIGNGIGNLVGWGAGKLFNSPAQLTNQAAQNAQRDAAQGAATQAGYVVPPADVNPGVINEVLNGLSGKIKTAQVASAKNQPITNQLARDELGVSRNTPLDIKTLDNVRSTAGQQYANVANLGTITPGPSYANTLDQIIAPYTQAARSFPNAKTNPVVDEINALRTPSFDAGDAVAKIGTLREDAKAAYAKGDASTGKALNKGAAALEQAIDDHLSKAGPSPLLAQFREARKLIAKTYTVQKSLNPVTGDVSAPTLAAELAKGKPLSGNLKNIATIATAFPKSMQALKEAPKQFSPLDFLVASMHGAGTALTLGARPLVRAGILSKPYQRLMLPNNYTPGLLDKFALPALQSEALKRSLIGTGIDTSLNAGLLSPTN